MRKLDKLNVTNAACCTLQVIERLVHAAGGTVEYAKKPTRKGPVFLNIMGVPWADGDPSADLGGFARVQVDPEGGAAWNWYRGALLRDPEPACASGERESGDA